MMGLFDLQEQLSGVWGAARLVGAVSGKRNMDTQLRHQHAKRIPHGQHRSAEEDDDACFG